MLPEVLWYFPRMQEGWVGVEIEEETRWGLVSAKCRKVNKSTRSCRKVSDFGSKASRIIRGHVHK